MDKKIETEKPRNKKHLCVFIHYFPKCYIPLNVQMYLTELSKHFDEIILVTNSRKIEGADSLLSPNISLVKVKNEGYDLGMFYKIFHKLQLNNYHSIACVNDSNILFGKLDSIISWGRKQQVDFWGIMDSTVKPYFSTHVNNYHIQSHFIVFNERTFPYLKQYLSSIDMDKLFHEKDIKTLRNSVIDKWEIGISQYLISNNFSCSSYVRSEEYYRKYSKSEAVNISLKLYDKLVIDGIPIMKKKVIFSFKPALLINYKTKWRKLIRQYGEDSWNTEELITELTKLKVHLMYTKIQRMLKRKKRHKQLTERRP